MKRTLICILAAASLVAPNITFAKTSTENSKKIAVVKKVFQNFNNHRSTNILKNATPTFLRAVRNDNARTPDGEMNCQPWDMMGGSDPMIKNPKFTTNKKGNVLVSYRNHGSLEKLEFQLTKTGSRYAIADIWNTDEIYEGKSFISLMNECQLYGL